MFDKLEITGTIRLETGLHIGTVDGFSAIGAIDSYIIRDVLTNEPMIPGSSLKGKLRNLLAKRYAKNPMEIELEDEDIRVKRLFGTSSGKNNEKPLLSRLIFSDIFLSNKEDLEKQGIESTTEIKMENSIDRLTAIANPRSIERVIRGAEFEFSLIYELNNEDEVIEDMETISEGFKLLQMDYLGGNGSRGYGRVKIENLNIESLLFQIDEEVEDRLNEIINSR